MVAAQTSGLEDGAPTEMRPWDLSHFVTIPPATEQVPDYDLRLSASAVKEGRLSVESIKAAGSSPLPYPTPKLSHTALLLLPHMPGRKEPCLNPNSLLGTTS